MFTNKSTIEKIDKKLINSDFGVLMFRSASFNNFEIKKYQNEDGTPNDLAVQKIYECLKHKHRSVFFGSRLELITDEIDYNDLSFEEIQGIRRRVYFGHGRRWYFTSISIYLAMRWLYYKPDYISKYILKNIEEGMQKQYSACYQALQKLKIENPKPQMTFIEIFLFEASSQFISFKAQLPIFIARQFYRHRGINFTERSGRYTAENTQFYKPDNWRKAPLKATQGSIENEFVKEKEPYIISFTTNRGKLKSIITNILLWTGLAKVTFCYKSIVRIQNQWFENNLENKMCKEQARMILPQSQMTTTINTVDLCTLSSILSQRLDKHAQLEIREVAQQLYNIACEEFGKELIDKLIDIQNRMVF